MTGEIRQAPMEPSPVGPPKQTVRLACTAMGEALPSLSHGGNEYQQVSADTNAGSRKPSNGAKGTGSTPLNPTAGTEYRQVSSGK